MKCSSCGLKKTLQLKPSKLMPGTRLNMCEECMPMEPRYLIVIFGRQNGINSIAEYLRRHLYVGDEIKARELV